MNTKGINQAMATVKSVAKKSTKVFAAALPVLSIAANVAGAANDAQGDFAVGINSLIRRYSGFNPATGEFKLHEAMQGSGSLLVTTAVGAVLTALA